MLYDLEMGMRNPTDKSIEQELANSKNGCRSKDIMQKVDKPRSVVCYRLLRLEAAGIIKAERKPKSTIYYLASKKRKEK